MITIIDYKMGNLGSILNMFKRLGYNAIISSEAKDIETSSALILPGVGAFDSGIRNFNRLGIRDLLEKKVFVEKVPFLGICLGMQLLSNKSAEGSENGLGWIDGETLRFPSSCNGTRLRIPHMGWNFISVIKENALFKGLNAESRYYFVHGYHVACNTTDTVAATTRYGIEFHSAVQRDNVYGVQFHPEKSHKFGMVLLKNFAEMAV